MNAYDDGNTVVLDACRNSEVWRKAGDTQTGAGKLTLHRFRFDNSAYDQSNAETGPDQALVMRGRFPRCRFANVVLWNHCLQTPPYRHRRISLNRRQTRCDRDGAFRMIVAHRDPGVPNWIDAAGLPTGMIFWRFLLPEENVPPIETELVPISTLR